MFERVNAMGEVVGKPTEKPTSRIGQNNQKQVGVLYGHNGSGKVYNYLASPNINASDTVTPMVTRHGKTYKTLARVQYTRDSLGGAARNTAANLSGRGIMLKTIGPTDQRSLPGFQQGVKEGKFTTVKAWAEDSSKRYNEAVMKRLNALGVPTGGKNE